MNAHRKQLRRERMSLNEGNRLFVISDRGLLSCLDSESGDIVYQYQVTPRLWAMSTPAVHAGVVYVSAMDGSVTALR